MPGAAPPRPRDGRPPSGPPPARRATYPTPAGPGTLDELVDWLAAAGERPGEAPGLSDLDHGLQCAAVLRRRRPDDLALQVAGLVHDLGHALADDDGHAAAGAGAVRPLLGDRVARLVGDHVAAKRYLVATDPAYVATLSPVSVASLALQGGALDAGARAAFTAAPGWPDALVLRRADEAAKVPGRPAGSLDDWRPALAAVARAAAGRRQ